MLTEETESPADPDLRPAERRFRSVAVLENGRPRPLVPGTDIELMLFADSVSARAGCNTLAASLTVEPDRLVVGPVSSTELFCSAERTRQDEWLAGILGSSPNWTERGGGIRLTCGSTTIEFAEIGPAEGAEPAALWGTTFDAVSVGDSGVVPAPVVPDTTITLTFRAPDRLAARAGCNTLGFRVLVGPDRLTVDDRFSSTRMACTPELMAQDDWLAAFLTDDPAYGYTGGTLTLTRGSATILLAARTGEDARA